MKNTDITWSASASGLCADDVYRLSAKREYNPNNLKASDYTEELAHSVQQAREKLMEMMLDLNEKYGTPKQKARMYVMKRFMTQEEKDDFINSIMNYNIIYYRKRKTGKQGRSITICIGKQCNRFTSCTSLVGGPSPPIPCNAEQALRL